MRFSGAVLLALASLVPVAATGATRAPTSVALAAVGQVGGFTAGVSLQGEYVFATIGPRLLTFHLDGIGHVVAVGQTPPFAEHVDSLDVSNGFAFVGGLEAIHVVDVRDPTSPAEIAHVAAHVARFAIQWPDLYVLEGADLRIVSVADPAHPRQTSTVRLPQGGANLAVADGRAYIGEFSDPFNNRGGMLDVIDISSSDRPAILSRALSLDEGPIAVQGRLLYQSGMPGLVVVDVSDPRAPRRVGLGPGVSGFLALGEGVVYVLDSSGSVHAWSVADAERPHEVGSFDLPAGGGLRMVVAGRRAAVALGTAGFAMLDLADPARPLLASAFETIGSASNVVVRNGVAYIADAATGLRILSVADPSQLTELGAIHPTCSVPFGVAVVGQFAYVRGNGHPGEHCAAIIDVGDPRQPVERATIALDAEGHGLAVDGSRLFLPDGNRLRIFDVADPATPAELGSLDLPWYALEIAMSGSFVYVAGYFPADGEITIIDVDDPSAPAQVGAWTLGGMPLQVVSTEGLLYALAWPGSVWVLDVSDPSSPAELARIHIDNFDPSRLAIDGSRAYVAGSLLRMLDLSDPSHPRIIGELSGTGLVQGLAAQGGVVYAAMGANGLWIFEALELDSFSGADAATGATDSSQLSLRTHARHDRW